MTSVNVVGKWNFDRIMIQRIELFNMTIPDHVLSSKHIELQQEARSNFELIINRHCFPIGMTLANLTMP